MESRVFFGCVRISVRTDPHGSKRIANDESRLSGLGRASRRRNRHPNDENVIYRFVGDVARENAIL
jgi:hypothetical protein